MLRHNHWLTIHRKFGSWRYSHFLHSVKQPPSERGVGLRRYSPTLPRYRFGSHGAITDAAGGLGRAVLFPHAPSLSLRVAWGDRSRGWRVGARGVVPPRSLAIASGRMGRPLTRLAGWGARCCSPTLPRYRFGSHGAITDAAGGLGRAVLFPHAPSLSLRVAWGYH